MNINNTDQLEENYSVMLRQNVKVRLYHININENIIN